MLLITQYCLGIAKASSYFKRLNTLMFMYCMPTFTTYYSSTAAFNGCYSKLMSYKALAFTGLFFTTYINAKVTPINDMDYSCHTTAV